MSKRIQVVLGLAAAAALGIVAGFLLGIRVGVWQFALLDSSAKASVIAFQLRTLRGGETAKVIQAKELALDGEVAMFCRFLEEGRPWIFWPQNRYFDHARSMRNIADYRMKYPPATPRIELEDDNPMREELLNFAQDVSGCTQQVIDTYGK